MTNAAQLALDLDEGRSRRDAGLASVEEHYSWVQRAREFAVNWAWDYGTVDTDIIQLNMPRPAGVHPNAVGSILRPPLFVKVGRRQSGRPTAHAREITVWALNEELERGAGTSKVTALKSAKGNPTGGGLAHTRAPANAEENNR